MARPIKPRKILFDPEVYFFKPRAVPLFKLKEVSLGRDELEALKYVDLEDLSQAKAARKMEISRSTFQRILSQARKKVAEALIKGKAIRVEKKLDKQSL